MYTFDLVRHPQAITNTTPEIIAGRSNDTAVTAHGIEQAILLADRYQREDEKYVAVHSSTAVRAVHLAQKIGAAIGYADSDIFYSESLLEQCQGDYVGKNRFNIYPPELVKKVLEMHGAYKAPNGESLYETAARMIEFLYGIIDTDDNEGNHIIVSHGGAIRATISALFGIDFNSFTRIDISNTSITQITFDDHQWRLNAVNDTGHLKTV